MKTNGLFLIAGIIAGILITTMYKAINEEQMVENAVKKSPVNISGKVTVQTIEDTEQKHVKKLLKSPDIQKTGETEKHERDIVDPHLLVRMFPENRALPVFTEEGRLQRKQEKHERDKLFGKITANKASEDEVRNYYTTQKRLSEDSIQLLEFVLDEYGDSLNERSLKKHEFLLKQFKKRLEHIPEKEEAALARLKAASNKNG